MLDRVLAAPLIEPTAVERVRGLYYDAYLSILQGAARSARKLFDIATASQPDPRSDPLCHGLGLEVGAMIDMTLDADIDPSGSLREAIETFAGQDDPRTAVMFVDAIGVSVLLAALRGDTESANVLGARGLAAVEDSGDVIWRAYIEYSLGVDAWVQGNYHKAEAMAVAALNASPDQLLVTHCIELLAWCAASQDAAARAAKLFGAADRRWRHLRGFFSGFHGISENRARCLTATRRAQTSEAFATAYEAGQNLSVADIAAETTRQTTRDATPAPPARRTSPLTSREQEVATLVAEGLSNREIAARLTISPRTAESHVDHILTKLDLTNRTQVVAWVLHR